jgi:hypothetical protein
MSATADRPALLVCADNGPTAVEYILHFLAACLTAGVTRYSTRRPQCTP